MRSSRCRRCLSLLLPVHSVEAEEVSQPSRLGCSLLRQILRTWDAPSYTHRQYTGRPGPLAHGVIQRDLGLRKGERFLVEAVPTSRRGAARERWVVSEVDLDRKAVAGIGDSIQTGVHGPKPHQSRIRDGLIEVIVEDRERAAGGR